MAMDWVGWAQQVCFLGCGFHQFVLDRLDMPSSLGGKTVLGTAYGLDPGFLSGLQRTFAPVGPKFASAFNIMDFFRSYELLHHP